MIRVEIRPQGPPKFDVSAAVTADEGVILHVRGPEPVVMSAVAMLFELMARHAASENRTA